jgi:hypothetical protein
MGSSQSQLAVRHQIADTPETFCHACERLPTEERWGVQELTHIHIEICSSGGPRLDNLGCLQRSR